VAAKVRGMEWTGAGVFVGSALLTAIFSRLKNKVVKPVSKYGYPNDRIADQIEPTVLEAMRLEVDKQGDELLEFLCLHNHSFNTCKPLQIRELLAEFLLQEAKNGEQRSLNKLSEVPEWVDWDLIEQGQCLFLRYPTVSSMALMYYSHRRFCRSKDHQGPQLHWISLKKF
jgi:hypothetical protein